MLYPFELMCIVHLSQGHHETKITRCPFLSQTISCHLLSLSCQHLPSDTHTHTQQAYQNSRKGHLCLPGLPCDKEEAVIGSINPIRAPLANHHSSSGISTAAAAAVMLQDIHPNVREQSMQL